VDPLLFEASLSDEERMIRDGAPAYCQEKLFSVVFEAKRHEHFDQQMMSEMGALGFRCATIAGYGCAVANYVSYGLIAREIERLGSAIGAEPSHAHSMTSAPRRSAGIIWRSSLPAALA
jgi:glutaryl-CoA dehydrogenase